MRKPKTDAKTRAERERRARAQAKEELLQRELTELYTVTSTELLAASSEEQDFVVPDAIPAGAITFIAGDKGERKSWLTYDLALAVCRGRSWLCFDEAKKGNVLVLNYDNPTNELGRRFRRMGLRPQDGLRAHSLGINRKREIPADLPALLMLPECDEAIVRIITHLEPTLIILDSLRRSHTMAENSQEDMAQLMGIFRRWTARGSALVVLHHMPKGPAKGPMADDRHYTLRGAGELEGSADALAFVQHGRIWWEKTRGWEQQTRECSFAIVDEGEATEVRVVDRFGAIREALAGGPLNRKDVLEAIPLPRAERELLLERAIEIGLVEVRRNAQGARSRVLAWKMR